MAENDPKPSPLGLSNGLESKHLTTDSSGQRRLSLSNGLDNKPPSDLLSLKIKPTELIGNFEQERDQFLTSIRDYPIIYQDAIALIKASEVELANIKDPLIVDSSREHTERIILTYLRTLVNLAQIRRG